MAGEGDGRTGRSTAVPAFVWNVARLALVAFAAREAYRIRLHAITTYGKVIHEFDPWFNFRATQYLADNGWDAFFSWFDRESWYPLGRPVGTTIYPGMQVTSVALWHALNYVGVEMSLNDVCVYVPTWFGAVATVLLALLATEVSGNGTVGAVAAVIMAIIPAHIMRSVGGGYDNESVAMTAMMLTFFLWNRALRNRSSWWIGALAGLAYFYMAAVWGGYIFVLNMIGVHAGGLVVLGRYNNKLYRAYTLFYVIGTALAIQVPVVGLTPLKSLEQLGAAAVFVLLQLLKLADIIRNYNKWGAEKNFQVRAVVLGVAAVAAAVLVSYVIPISYFGPLSARVRGLFVQHTRTGNPLVDSVAEHQPASPDALWQYLHVMMYIAPAGFAMSVFNLTDAGFFGIFYAIAAYYFCTRMARLIIIAGPAAAIMSAMAIGSCVHWGIEQYFLPGSPEPVPDTKSSKSKKKKKAAPKTFMQSVGLGAVEDGYKAVKATVFGIYDSRNSRTLRKAFGVAFVLAAYMIYRDFNKYCQELAPNLSHPSIMFKARLRDGTEIMVDDYREAYWWLRDNTPQDSRVLAWWDYGYQIAGIGNRTTIADGNTWNHEHIATLGRALTSPEKRAHRMVRHLADYVLIWAGGGGDDLAKSPHMARIGNSVYDDICPNDPTCQQFGFDHQGQPTPMMAASLLYKLHSHGTVPGVYVDKNRFQEVYRSKYAKVRIFKVMSVSQKSKAWVANPKNWLCDEPGSWYCPGQYPPALHKIIKKARPFKQLEDFNVDVEDKDVKYREQYMRKMAGK